MIKLANMRLKFLLNTFALVLSVAGQSWTTWTSLYVVGTVTVTITSTVTCPTSWTTTTQVTTTTVCSICHPECQWGSYTTTVCGPATTCVPVTTCTPLTTCIPTLVCTGLPTCASITTCTPVVDCAHGPTCTPSTTCAPVVDCANGVTCTPLSTCGLVTTCDTAVVTGCQPSDPPDPPATSDYYGYTFAQQEQPYTTITSGTIVYVVMPSTGVAAGQEIVSAAERFRDHDGSLMANSFALVVIMLALMLM